MVFWLHTARTENPFTPQTHPSASDFHEYHAHTPRYPPNIPQTSPRHLQGAGDANRGQQTLTDNARCTPAALFNVFECLGLSVCVWRRLLMSVGISCFLELSGGCLVGMGRCLSDIHGNWRQSDKLLGYLGSQSLQYGAASLFWHNPERHNFCSPDYNDT